MSNTSPRNAAFIVTVCLLVVFAFTSGYLISTRSNPTPDVPPNPATVVPIASAPATLPDPVAETPPTPEPSPQRGRPLAPPLTDVTGKPFRPAPFYTFDATIYDLRISPDQVSRLDADALTKAAITREEFEKALAALGTARPLYSVHSAANFNEEQYWKVTNETPATGPASAPAPPLGRSITNFKEPGAVFDLILHPSDTGVFSIDIAVKASLLLQSTAPPGFAAASPLFRNIEYRTQRAVTLNQPFLLMSADATALDSSGKALALIARINISSATASSQAATTSAPTAPVTAK